MPLVWLSIGKGRLNIEGYRMIVIADDITGAAEMAGIAYANGLHVRMVCSVVGGSLTHNGVDAHVIVTDTRSMTQDEAVEETHRIASQLPKQSLIFKKTDSALRGHVVAELRALMAVTGYRRAVYMPANPSKGRIIRDGTYFIDGIPLAETAFSYDPEFPAHTSVLRERFPDAEAAGIIMPDAVTVKDIHNIVEYYHDGDTLFAGGADLFMCHKPPSPLKGEHQRNGQPHPLQGAWGLMARGGVSSLLVLCGSTQSKPQLMGLAESPMPLTVYDGSHDLQPWLADALPKYLSSGSLMLTIPHHHRTGRAAAIHLRQMMAAMASQLMQSLSESPPQCLVIEGGATAYATLQQLNVGRLSVTGQIASGVVSLQADNGLRIILKPGSYPLNMNQMNELLC